MDTDEKIILAIVAAVFLVIFIAIGVGINEAIVESPYRQCVEMCINIVPSSAEDQQRQANCLESCNVIVGRMCNGK